MKKILQNPKARVWFLSGLTGMVLIAGLLLEEGQARTYTPSITAPLQVNKQNLQTHLSERIKPKKSQVLKSSLEQETRNPSHAQAGARQTTSQKKNGPCDLVLRDFGRGRLIFLITCKRCGES